MKKITTIDKWFTQQGDNIENHIFAKEIYLPDAAEESKWIEITDEEKKAIENAEAIDILNTDKGMILEFAKETAIQEIDKYDNSSAVNSFIFNGKELWLDKATRVGLMNSTLIAKDAGKETCTLWLGELHVSLPCDTIIQMLSKLELYALECYNVTALHKAMIRNMTEISEIKNFDVTKDYPNKLTF